MPALSFSLSFPTSPSSNYPVLFSNTDRTDKSCVEERDQKVSVGLGGVPPWAFRHRSLLKTSLGSTLWRNSQSCLAGPSKPPESKIAAVGSTKRLPWSHNDYPRLVRGSRPLDFYFTTD